MIQVEGLVVAIIQRKEDYLASKFSYGNCSQIFPKLIHRAHFCVMFVADSLHLLIHITNFISLQSLFSSQNSYHRWYFIAIPTFTDFISQISFSGILPLQTSFRLTHRLHFSFHFMFTADFISLHYTSYFYHRFHLNAFHDSCCLDQRFHYGLLFICYICHRLHFSFRVTFMADFIPLTTSHHSFHFIALPIFTSVFASVYFTKLLPWLKISFSGYFNCRFHFVCYIRHRLAFSSMFQHRFHLNYNY